MQNIPILRAAAFACSLFFFLPLSAQTLRGALRDADNGNAITGANLTLQFSRGQAASVASTTGEGGEFLFEKIRPGYYTLRISAEGFETQTISEINVAAGKEQVLDLALRRSNSRLPEVTVTAVQPGRRAPLPQGEIPLTRDQTLRFPAMFFDPARLAAAYPGVSQADDGTNMLSIRGTSPAMVRWRLEGVDIVNPNHLANAGTFSDRPAAASGGVLMFSAQLLDNSSLLNGAFPAGYGNALGGVFDMNLRRGNTQQHEFTAQAGLVGLDFAAEGPLFKKSKTVGGSDVAETTYSERNSRASYLVNYRYSTVGLLGQLGVSFGDEQINFQDLSFNLFFPGKRGGRWTVFGLGGLSENRFRHKTDSTEVKAYKDFFDIDFTAKTGVLGVSNWNPAGENAWLKTVLAVSSQRSERFSSSPTYSERASEDWVDESKISGSLTYSHRLKKGFGLMLGANYTQQVFSNSSIYEGTRISKSGYIYPLFQPWAQVSWRSKNGRTNAAFGIHELLFVDAAFSRLNTSNEPRLSVSHRFRRHQIGAAMGIYSQIPMEGLSKSIPFIHLLTSNKTSVFYIWNASEAWSFKLEAYRQDINEAGYTTLGNASILNTNEVLPNVDFASIIPAQGYNESVEFSAERRLQNGWFLLANVAVLESKFRLKDTPNDRPWLPTRWDIGHLANLTFGKEWQREKRPGKERTIGLNARAVTSGGVRDADIRNNGTLTEVDENRGYTLQFPDYFRLDLRVYWRKNLGNRRNSTFALDIQNLTGQQNLAYHYYDPHTDRVENKFQLGTIPNFSWRLEF